MVGMRKSKITKVNYLITIIMNIMHGNGCRLKLIKVDLSDLSAAIYREVFMHLLISRMYLYRDVFKNLLKESIKILKKEKDYS